MTNMAYLASSGLCIGAIACLSNQKTARTGNALGLMGVGGGIAATLGAIGGTAPLYGQIIGEVSLLLFALICTDAQPHPDIYGFLQLYCMERVPCVFTCCIFHSLG